MNSRLYDSGFYDCQKEGSLASARVVLSELLRRKTINSILDVGCGVGAWLRVAHDLGVEEIVGLDGDYVPRAALVIPETNFLATDISASFDLHHRFDLAICLEAAEHLPATAAADLIASLTRHSDLVLFSAALPFQGGTGHINENWLEYWSALFAAHGFHAVDGLRWRFWNDPRVEWWYRQNLMLFQSATAERLISWESSLPPVSAVHPELFLRAVRRRPTAALRTSLAHDVEHWRASANGPAERTPGYGPEFGEPTSTMPHVSTYAELKAAPRWQLPAVLADAISACRLAETAPPRLSRSPLAPDFVGLGVQKSASTWLYGLLNQHPRTMLPPGKEMNFFNRRAFAPWSAHSGFGLVERVIEQMRTYLAVTPNVWPPWVKLLAHIANPANDQSWYDGVFDLPLPEKRVRGEITPEYSLLPASGFEEMKTINPNIKVILFLRDPVERAVSHFGMLIDQVPAAKGFLANLAREESIIRRGRYQEIITALRYAFAPEQLFIAFVDEVRADPRGAADRIGAFLDLDPALFPQDAINARVHERGSTLEVTADIEGELRAHYEETYRFMAEEFPAPCRTWLR